MYPPLCYPELAHFGSKRIDKTESKHQFARIDIQAYCIYKNKEDRLPWKRIKNWHVIKV